MLSLMINLLKLPWLDTLLNRLSNRFTAHGVIIILLQLEGMGVLPEGTAKAVDGLPVGTIISWSVISVGVYFIMHRPKLTKLDKAKQELELLKVQQEINNLKQTWSVKNNLEPKLSCSEGGQRIQGGSAAKVKPLTLSGELNKSEFKWLRRPQ